MCPPIKNAKDAACKIAKRAKRHATARLRTTAHDQAAPLATAHDRARPRTTAHAIRTANRNRAQHHASCFSAVASKLDVGRTACKCNSFAKATARI